MRHPRWNSSIPLSPWNATGFAVLSNCAQVDALVSSLPANASDRRWATWGHYVDAIYNETVPRHINLRHFSFFRGVALHNKSHSLSDRTLWQCEHYTASNVYTQGSRAIVVWPTRGPLALGAVAHSNEWVEVYRQQVSTAWNPEGLGYGCWYHMARGTAIWANVGRTLGLTRSKAAQRFGHIAFQNGSLWDPAAERLNTQRFTAGMKFKCHVCISQAASGHLTALGLASLSGTPGTPVWDASTSCASVGAQAAPGGRIYSVPCLDGVWALNAARQGFDSLQLLSPGWPEGENEVELLLTGKECTSSRRQPLGVCPPLPITRAGIDARRPCDCHEEEAKRRFPGVSWRPSVCFS